MFRHFNSSAMELPPASFKDPHYRFLAADGSTCTFFSTPAFSSPDYYCSPGHSANGVYSMHLNAFFDLDTHTYMDALIQPVRCKNEFGAFCDIVDRHDVLDGRKNVYIGDRGYCSYNNMANRDSISCSVPRISIPKDWLAILIFRMRNPSILMSASYWSGAIRKKFWQTSTQKVTYALLIRQLLSITLNMEVMIHMSCPSVLCASLSAILHTSAS